jgi:hypothetical protein
MRSRVESVVSEEVQLVRGCHSLSRWLIRDEAKMGYNCCVLRDRSLRSCCTFLIVRINVVIAAN